ncbi:uncharacterized protein [Nicotiana tomentosiformis]|uniref:uncharacterized protein n=1 Tax=Nicotiana tomentosiformis TaxID=4098 RepID=UPI00388C436D
MAKTSKIVPQKENASSSRPAGDKTPMEPRPEECVPGGYVIISDFKTDKVSSILGRCLDKDAVMRPPSGEEETSAPVPKPAKDNKRKRTSASKDRELKERTAHKPRKNTIPLTEESIRCLRDEDEEEENDDGSILVARGKKTIDAPKTTRSMVVDEAPPRTEGISEKDSGKVPESLEIEDVSHRNEQTVDISEGTGLEALRTEENAPSDSFGKIALALHQEAFSKSRAELSRCEADFRGLPEERNALKLLSGQKEEDIRDLRAELAKAHKDQTDLIEQVMKIIKAHGLDSGTVANISISQLQQKIERIEQFREEVDTIKVESLEWNEGMDRFAAEKETARAQLSSVESQLQGMKERSSTQARKIEELEARLASELAKAKSEAEKAKAKANAIVAVYQADAEATQVQVREASESAQTRAYWIVELAKCQFQRETLKEIHARGFDLTNEIEKAREYEAETIVLATSDDDDDDGSKSGSENGEDLDVEEAATGGDQEP